MKENRERIISWLFSEESRKQHEKKEEKKPKKKKKDEKTEKKTKTEIKTEEKSTIVKENDEWDVTTKEKIEEEKQEITETTESTLPQPTLFVDSDVVLELKEQQIEKNEDLKDETNNIFPEIEEIEIIDLGENDKTNIETSELVELSIIEEIDELLYNDNEDLKGIKYEVEVLNQQDQDDTLLENTEKIRQELDEIIKKFNELKKKYEEIYSTISLKDIDNVNDYNISLSINDYIVNGKEGIDNSTTLNQIEQIEEFIDIINEIIEVEKEKDKLEETVDNKLVDLDIKEEEFYKLQDNYADIEKINDMLDKYNRNMDEILDDIDKKIENSLEITKEIEEKTKLVPNINRMMEATFLMASIRMVPPTPAGNLFKTGLYMSAIHMMATSIDRETETKEVTTSRVTDYSRDIIVNKDSITKVLGNIEDAFLEIDYMKDTFDKNLGPYKNQIPEYDRLVKNIFQIEKELSREQATLYDYNNRIDMSLKNNYEKVKKIEE